MYDIQEREGRSYTNPPLLRANTWNNFIFEGPGNVSVPDEVMSGNISVPNGVMLADI